MKFTLEIELGNGISTLGDISEAVAGTLEAAELIHILKDGHRGYITNKTYDFVGKWEVVK